MGGKTGTISPDELRAMALGLVVVVENVGGEAEVGRFKG